MLKEKYGGEVMTVTMGPNQAKAMLLELKAMGVDKTYLLSDAFFAGSDTWATSWIISNFLKTLDFDLVIAGYQAIDGDTAQVGPQVAEFLNVPQVTHLSSIEEYKDGELIVVKKGDYELEKLAVTLPALVTTCRDMNTPREMSAFHIWQLEESDVQVRTFADLNVERKDIGLAGSPTKVKQTYTKPVTSKSPVVTLTPDEAARKIIDLLYPYMEVKSHG